MVNCQVRQKDTARNCIQVVHGYMNLVSKGLPWRMIFTSQWLIPVTKDQWFRALIVIFCEPEQTIEQTTILPILRRHDAYVASFFCDLIASQKINAAKKIEIFHHQKTTDYWPSNHPESISWRNIQRLLINVTYYTVLQLSDDGYGLVPFGAKECATTTMA